MANFELDIDFPHKVPTKEEISIKPEVIPYSVGSVRYKHYGKIVEKLAERIAEMEPGEERTLLIGMLANHMKKAYLLWNKEAVNDDVILGDMKLLSKDKISIDENMKLTESRDLLNRNRKNKRMNRKK